MIDPDSLPAHAIEAAMDELCIEGDDRPDWDEGVRHAVAAFLEAEGWTVRQEWRVVNADRTPLPWRSTPPTREASSDWHVVSRIVLIGPRCQEKP